MRVRIAAVAIATIVLAATLYTLTKRPHRPREEAPGPLSIPVQLVQPARSPRTSVPPARETPTPPSAPGSGPP